MILFGMIVFFGEWKLSYVLSDSPHCLWQRVTIPGGESIQFNFKSLSLPLKEHFVSGSRFSNTGISVVFAIKIEEVFEFM